MVKNEIIHLVDFSLNFVYNIKSDKCRIHYGTEEPILGCIQHIIVGRETFSRTRQLTSEAGRGTYMRKIKPLILVLVLVMAVSFSFDGIAVSAKTIKHSGKKSTKKVATKKRASKKSVAKKTTSKKKASAKKKVATRRTSKKKLYAKKKVSKKSALKSKKTKRLVSKKKTARKTASKKKSKKTASKRKSRRILASSHRGYSRGSGSTVGDGSVSRVISYAKRYLGVTYDFGSSSSRSFDCSGFTMFIYRAAGVKLPHSAAGQANIGLAVDKSNLKPGDLVFFQTYKPGISHVGMYIGNGHFIHASSGAGQVTITSLSDSYYVPRFRGGVRLLNE